MLLLLSVVSMVSSWSVRLMRSTANHFIRNQVSCGFRSTCLGYSYRPEWKIRGSLWRSSANSKKALSGLTAYLRFDHKGMLCEASTISLCMEESLLEPKRAKRSQPTIPPTTPENRPPTGIETPLRLRTGRERRRVA